MCSTHGCPPRVYDTRVLGTRRCDIIRGGMEQYLTPMGPTKLHVHPIFEIGPLEPRYRCGPPPRKV